MKKIIALTATLIGLATFTAAPAQASDIGFGIYLGTPAPVVQNWNHGYTPRRAAPRPAVPARFVRRDVRAQGCYNISEVRQRGSNYVVRANCGRRSVPVRFVYDAYTGRQLQADRMQSAPRPVRPHMRSDRNW